MRRDKSDLGEHFVAPDGGWAWLVCIAAGVSNLSIYPCLQQFGFMFRVHLAALGLSNSQITTIINANPAISACTGLLNGPMFRRFTYRQVALAGSFCIFIGIILTAHSHTFLTYMVSYALLYGFGMGISVSASSLAINTYFKNKRRRAAGFSWTITGLGPIFLPHFVTYLVTVYGVNGTVMIFASLSLHAIVCALIYQPAHYHVPRSDVLTTPAATEATKLPPEACTALHCKHCGLPQRPEFGLFCSQYLCQDDDEAKPGYEITEPGTPMLSRANDGWFGSKLSLASTKNSVRFRTGSSGKNLECLVRLNKIRSMDEARGDDFLRPINFKRERDDAPWLPAFYASHCSCSSDKNGLELSRFQTPLTPPTTPVTSLANAQYLLNGDNATSAGRFDERITFVQKVVTFFDLDLLRDFTYVNLVAGLTIINFGELNFSILTPFILHDFGFNTSQITLAMSVLGSLDIVVRFLVPFCTDKISWDNRIFFLIGVVGIALGRTVVACTRSYPVILGCFVWIGMCKGVRTIFWPLIIPSYVPLKRLPAASGLQLLISGLFTLAAGPFVGLVRDRFDYSVTLHCLNMMSFIAATSWSLEALLRRYYCPQQTSDDVDA